MTNPTAEQRPEGRATIEFTRRDFLKAGAAAGMVAGGGLGAFYFGYEKAVGSPLRVGVIGTGDEGSVLIGAITPQFIEVKSIADIRPYNQYRAFHGDYSSDDALKARPGLMAKYGWKSEGEAKRRVKVYKQYQELIDNARHDGIEAVIIALPLHLHAPAAVYAMRAGLHVITEKLMGHTVHECKEMARISRETKRILATGHQRHYSILYANAMDMIQRGVLGEVHSIRAQWHRSNMPPPGTDSWKQPLPPGAKTGDPLADNMEKSLKKLVDQLTKADGDDVERLLKRIAQTRAQIADKLLCEKQSDGKCLAEQYGYEHGKVVDTTSGKTVYDCPPIEELIRWRLWDRTGAGLMAELGSHQLDAATLFLAAMYGGKTHPHPLSVAAAGTPLFPADRDIEDHVFCIIEFPAPGYDAKDPWAAAKKIGVQYSSINGNGFGGYGEIVYGTKGTLIIERELEKTLIPNASAGGLKISGGKESGPTMDTQASGASHPAATKVSVGSSAGGPTMDTQASGPSHAGGVSRGYTEELEHWAWCIRNPAPENKPRCHPEVAMGDAVIALVTNMAARQGRRIEFKPTWFEVDSDDTPEDVKPDISRYNKA